MNVIKDFTDYISSSGFGTFGDDLFIGGAPLNAPSTCWWVVSSGGSSVQENKTGERKNDYVIDVFYRNTDTEEVYEQLQALSDVLNSATCIELDNYILIGAECTTFPADRDLDSEERTIGVLQVTLTIYQ